MWSPLPVELADAIAAARDRLGTYASVLFAERVESTNDLALTLAAAGQPEGTSVVADVQLAGRGRRGRTWFSPAGSGLYVSTVVRPSVDWRSMPVLTLGAGVAAARAIVGCTGLPIELKWPNDLVIGRPWRKLGGILAEAATAGSRMDAVIIGIGLNLSPASYPSEIADRATSIETELGRLVDRASILVSLLAEVKTMMADVHAGRQAALCDAWRAFGAAGCDRAPVRWQEGARERRGIARDIDTDGALLIETANGIERVIAGEVIWERLSRD